MRTKHVLLLILAVIALSFLSGRLSLLGDRNAQNGAILALTDSLRVSKVEIHGLTYNVWEKNQVIITQRQSIEAGLVDRAAIKALNLRKGYVITKLETNLSAARDSIPVVFSLNPEPEIVSAGKTKNPCPFPAVEFSYNDEYLNLTAGVDTNKYGWFEMNAPTELTVYLGDKKTGLFQSTPTVTVGTLSPYLEVYNIDVVNTQETQWYDKWYLPAGAGFGLGILTWSVICGFF